MIKTNKINKSARILLSVLLILALLPISSAAAMGAAADEQEPVMFFVEYEAGIRGSGYSIEYVEAGTLYTVKTLEEAGIDGNEDEFRFWHDYSNVTAWEPGDQFIVDKDIRLEAIWVR